MTLSPCVSNFLFDTLKVSKRGITCQIQNWRLLLKHERTFQFSWVRGPDLRGPATGPDHSGGPSRVGLGQHAGVPRRQGSGVARESPRAPRLAPGGPAR